MSGIFGDGEPYELEQPVEKVDLDSALILTPINELVTFDLSIKNCTIPQKISKKGELNLQNFSNKQIRLTEHKLNFCQLIFLLMASLSSLSLHTWVFNLFINFSKDEYFSIRKICALNIGKFVNLMPEKFHYKFLDVFSRFMVDKNVLVVQAAYSSLGIFMYSLVTLDNRVLHWAQMLSCSDLAQACDFAYYLPAIYRKFCEHRESLYGIWKSLLKNPQSQVRSKAASTLSFFLKNSSPEVCMSLVTYYQNLLKDTDIVKVEAISHLGSLLEKLPESTQSQFLGTYRRIQTYNLNWRVNLKIAKSLVKIAKHLKIEYWMQELWQVSLSLIQDNSEIVRVRSAKSLGTVLKDLWNINSQWDEIIKNDLLKFLQGNYKKRQVLAYICGVCSEIQWFNQILSILQADKYPDVRLAVVTVACEYSIQWLKDSLMSDISLSIQSLVSKKSLKYKNKKKSFSICKEFTIDLSEFDEIYIGDDFN